jgi:NDP-sugar pyrophosphorylase family protein
VNGKTLLQRNIEYLQAFGIREVVVNVHHFSDQIIRAVQENNGWGSNITISDESGEVLETGGGVLFAADYFKNQKAWLVMNADILTNMPLDKMMAADDALKNSHNNYAATLAVTNRSTSRNLLFNQNELLTGWKNNTTMEEKWVGGKTNSINDSSKIIPKAFSGIQIIHAPFYTALQLHGKFSLIDAYLQIASTNPIGYYDHSDYILMDVGKPENLEKAATLFP